MSIVIPNKMSHPIDIIYDVQKNSGNDIMDEDKAATELSKKLGK